MALIAFFSVFFIFLFITASLQADDLSNIAAQISKLSQALESSKKNTQKNEQDLVSINNQLEELKTAVLQIEIDISKKEKDINVGEIKLIKQKEKIDNRILSFYKQKGRSRDLLLEFFTSPDITGFIKYYSYQQNLINEDKSEIIRGALLISDLESKKKELEKEKETLVPIKEEIVKQSQNLSLEIAKSKQYEDGLKKEIASLSARQQEIINQRSGGFTVNIGDSELADDYNASVKGFREAAPNGHFAVFSFGAYTHRKGMSQYGARGRAQSGQSYKQILASYYGLEPVSKDTSGSIKVKEHAEIDFETTYLYGISEMPSSWHKEALKAQAIASRTYALRFKSANLEICITEKCQVFRKSKSDNPPEAWKNAVDETRGEVLENTVAFYSSSSGGFTTTSGWDTTDKNGGSDFISKTFEKIGGSPWLYKAWYTQSYSINSDKCSRNNPWLSPVEMADIVNAALVLLKGSASEIERISPVTTACYSGNPYSHSELYEIAKKYEGIETADSVFVQQDNGVTKFVTINGVSINGPDFKKAFNLRAPGRLSIPQRGYTFINIEKK